MPVIIETAEALLNQEIKCLDKGFVRLVDYMGGDARIVQAARVSYGAGTKTMREDKGLINYLLKSAHTSPFEKVVLEFHMKLPIFVARQMIRSRVARVNEISGRYSVMKDDCYVPEPENVCFQATDNKQGRSGPLPFDDAEVVRGLMFQDQADVFGTYKSFVEQGVAKELARINLPLSTYTEWYWQIDLHNLFKFLKLRLDSHAQYEIRVYAEALAQCAAAVAPMAYEAFEDHILGAVTFSASELQLVGSCGKLLGAGEAEESVRYWLMQCGLKEKDASNLLARIIKMFPAQP